MEMAVIFGASAFVLDLNLAKMIRVSFSGNQKFFEIVKGLLSTACVLGSEYSDLQLDKVSGHSEINSQLLSTDDCSQKNVNLIRRYV